MSAEDESKTIEGTVEQADETVEKAADEASKVLPKEKPAAKSG